MKLWPQWQLSSWELSENYPAVTSVTAIQLWPQWELWSCDPSKSYTKSNQYLFHNSWLIFFFFSFFPCCLLTKLYFRLTRWRQSIQLGPTISTAPTMAWSVFRSWLISTHFAKTVKSRTSLVCSDALCKDLCLCFTGGTFFNGEFSVLCSWIRLLQMKTYESCLVSWCFEPSQPQRVISGLTPVVVFFSN